MTKISPIAEMTVGQFLERAASLPELTRVRFTPQEGVPSCRLSQVQKGDFVTLSSNATQEGVKYVAGEVTPSKEEGLLSIVLSPTMGAIEKLGIITDKLITTRARKKDAGETIREGRINMLFDPNRPVPGVSRISTLREEVGRVRVEAANSLEAYIKRAMAIVKKNS